MAFPEDESDLRFRAAFGANLSDDLTTLTYEDITDLAEPSVVISRGRIADATEIQPTTIDAAVRNPDGVFSPRNITGPFYGSLRRNTPVQVQVDPGAGMVTRAIAYSPDWPTRWTGPDIGDRIPLQASGALRRIGAGKETRSTPRRYLPGTSPVASWPLEDGQLVDDGAADVGGNPLRPFVGAHPSTAVFTVPSWGSGTLAPWLPPVLSLSGNNGLTAMWGEVSMPAFTTTWTVDLYYAAGADSNDVIIDINPSYLPGGSSQWAQLVFGASGQRIVLAHADGFPEAEFATPQLYDDRLHHVRWRMSQSGAKVLAEIWVDGVSAGTSLSTGSMTHPPVRAISLVAFQGDETGSGSVAVGYLTIWTTPPTLADAVLVAKGWAGEKAAVRFERLCGEEGIRCDVAAGDSEAMGPQAASPIPDLLRECEEADEGTMIERRTGELGFDPRSTRYNRDVTMTLDYLTQIASLDPDADDRDLLNVATVTRTYGASETYERTDGPLGTDSATGVERYAEPFTRNLFGDDQPIQHASYLVAAGTVDEPRYVIGFSLRDQPELIEEWLACDIGSRIQATNPPAMHTGPAPLDLIIEGYTELLDAVEWYVTLWCTPSAIFEILQAGGGTGNRSRLGAGPCTTDAQYGPTVTSLSVTSTVVRWIDSAGFPASFPFPVIVAGEVMTCTGITGTGLTQAMAVQRGLHGVTKTLPAGSTVQIWRGPRWGM